MAQVLYVAGLLVLLAACGGDGGGSDSPGSGDRNSPDEQQPGPPSGGPLDDAIRALVEERNLTGDPADGREPVTPDEDPLVRLGSILFFSRTLSAHYDVACASCHHPDLGGGDGLSLPVGVAPRDPTHLGPGREVDPQRDRDPQRDCEAATDWCGPNVPRNSQSIFNVSLYEEVLFHDGRVEKLGSEEQGDPLIRTPESGNSPDPEAGDSLLAAQAKLPLVSNNEMRGYGDVELTQPEAWRAMLMDRLRGTEREGRNFVTASEAGNWRELFENAFTDTQNPSAITIERVSRALAAYERSQVFVDTPWRAYLQGQGDISDQAKEGALLFYRSREEGGLGCAGCHSGDFLTDEDFHNVHVPQIGRGKRTEGIDFGRGDVTREQSNRFAFRTPSLLNVTETAPYGHTGFYPDLESFLALHVSDPDPMAGQDAWNQLDQFEGKAILSTYPDAVALTEAAIQADSNEKERLPSSPDDSEIGKLVAFLQTLTDDCVADEQCRGQWEPSGAPYPAGDDPDGNLLVKGEESPIDAHLPLPLEQEDDTGTGEPVELDHLTSAPRDQFREFEQCSPSSASNTGDNEFVSSIDSFQPRLEHHFSEEVWFNSRTFQEHVMVAGGVSAIYANDDCWPDLVAASGQDGLELYENRGGNDFKQDPDAFNNVGLESELGHLITGAGVADLNGDYRRELVLGNLYMYGDDTSPFKNMATFNQVVFLGRDQYSDWYQLGSLPMYRNTFGMAFGDADGDGDPDMYLAHWGLGHPSSEPVYWENRPQLDVMVSADEKIGLSGSDDVKRQFNFAPAFWDIDGDGDQDLTIASDFETSQVFEATGESGNQTYEQALANPEVISDENGMGSAVGDYDNDGDMDWFVSSIYDGNGSEGFWATSGNRLYRNDSTESEISFSNVTEEAGVRDGAWGWGSCMADFNNDGWLDIFHENGFGRIDITTDNEDAQNQIDFYANTANQFLTASPRLFINNGISPSGQVTFTDKTSEWGLDEPTNGRGIVCFDYDRDGDMDIAVLENSGTARIHTNQTGSGEGRGFVNVRVVGNPPNTEALGAKVRVTADLDNNGTIESHETQLRAATANSNYNSQNPPNLHFGLRSAPKVDKLEVDWPGEESNLVCHDVGINQFIVLDQRVQECPES